MYQYRVYRTQFHGGGLLSSHRTEAAAERAAAKYRGGECLCGCAAVVGPGAEPREAIDVASPYAPAAGPAAVRQRKPTVAEKKRHSQEVM